MALAFRNNKSPVRKLDRDNREKNVRDIRSELVNLDRYAVTVNIQSTLIDDPRQIQGAILALERCEELAVKCEGVNLGRNGSITLLQLGAENRPIYIFDLLKLGSMVFDMGLKRILESQYITKVMFDCRSDSDNLWREFGVRLSNVYDLQLLEYIVRLYTGGLETIVPPTLEWHCRKPITREMRDTVSYYINSCRISRRGVQEFKQVKDATHAILQKDKLVWKYRPIARGLVTYIALDILFVWEIFFILERRMPSTDIQRRRLKLASERYAGIRRDTEKVDAGLSRTGILPSYIIPKVGRNGILGFPKAENKCTGCTRYMPEVGELDSLCVDCREVKRCRDAFNALPAATNDDSYRAIYSYFKT